MKEAAYGCTWALCLLAWLKKIDKNKAEFYMKQYKMIIEKHKNYLEVFDADGKPYKTPFYYADEGMIWAAMFLELTI